MKKPSIPRDDLLDVIEMTQKMEYAISNILKDNELSLSMSALYSATINCIIAQCQTMEEVIFYRNLFMEIFDSSIRTIETTED
jgi:hypothetical protein